MNNKKKRKGSGTNDDYKNLTKTPINLKFDDKGSIIRSHLSLEDCVRLKKKCKEDVGSVNFDGNSSCATSRIVGVTTVPPCGGGLGLSSVEPSRGLKRKIGCIDVATQIGSQVNRLEDDYFKIKTIGKGRFGSVWLCRCKASGREYACKTLRKGEETVHREVEIMQHLSGHPGIVMLNAVYEDDEYFHLVMELCSGGRLVDQMTKEGRYSEQRAANVMKELMLVIKYCHEMGVVHRDIKPENILLTSSGKMKLADFGLAVRVSGGQSLTGVAGSPAYVAPEILSGSYKEKVDIWSAGILFHALLTGGLPFKGDSLEEVFEAIKSTKLDFHFGIWQSVSKPARDLIGKILTRDVSSRFSADDVLGHPFIMFYTERILKSLSIKSKTGIALEALSHKLVSTSLPGSDKRPSKSNSLSESSSLVMTSKQREPNSVDGEKQEDCCLMDALTVAIAQVRISEPKRSRLCLSNSIQQPYSTNSVCEAF
ncbi:serine/threonine-protein kinase PEPKR2-like [Silene latifolia]|uniref:serine/threonine-protein kinase PEPKR2-like n=1 Tax=Silene latifolia TaxID=37657 RepID=UPI003D771C3C